MSAATKIRVAVNGYGVIGKRVAAAVTLQDDIIPETIDAIRALRGGIRDPAESIAITNATLGIGPSLV